MRIVRYDSAVPRGEEGSGVSGECRRGILVRRTWEKPVLRGLFETWGQFVRRGGTAPVKRGEVDLWVLCGGWTVDYHLVNGRCAGRGCYCCRRDQMRLWLWRQISKTSEQERRPLLTLRAREYARHKNERIEHLIHLSNTPDGDRANRTSQAKTPSEKRGRSSSNRYHRHRIARCLSLGRWAVPGRRGLVVVLTDFSHSICR